jgi:hypothetical protein
MIAGIVLFALGPKKTIEQVGDRWPPSPPWRSAAGCRSTSSPTSPSAYASSIYPPHDDGEAGLIGPGRLATGIGMLALLPAALELSALTALALATGLCCALVAYDVIHYREDRARVRGALRNGRAVSSRSGSRSSGDPSGRLPSVSRLGPPPNQALRRLPESAGPQQWGERPARRADPPNSAAQ